MTFRNMNTSILDYKYKLVKKAVTSGASRSLFFFKKKLPLEIKFPKLSCNIKWKAGRGSLGKIILWTRKSCTLKHKTIIINHSFRLRYTCFIASIIMLPFSHKLLSLVFLSSGSVTYIPAAINHKLFMLTQLYSLFRNYKKFRYLSISLPKIFEIKQSFFLLKQLPRNQPVCLLEITPGEGIKYVRSPGSSSKVFKIDWRLGTGLVKLPSGVRKIFSIFSLASVGPVRLVENKLWKNNKAGFYKNYGRKSMVRGVAMNPVDHPHGGRAKSVKYQRTPWGKTTKFK